MNAWQFQLKKKLHNGKFQTFIKVEKISFCFLVVLGFELSLMLASQVLLHLSSSVSPSPFFCDSVS
jgi:hypothetical protein